MRRLASGVGLSTSLKMMHMARFTVSVSSDRPGSGYARGTRHPSPSPVTSLWFLTGSWLGAAEVEVGVGVRGEVTMSA
jgi:hypothetical protein